MDQERMRIQDDLRGLLAGQVRCDDIFLQLYASGAVDKLTQKDVLVVYDGSRFFGRDLKPFDLRAIDGTKRVVLAVTPDLSMAQAIDARRKIAAESDDLVMPLSGPMRKQSAFLAVNASQRSAAASPSIGPSLM